MYLARSAVWGPPEAGARVHRLRAPDEGCSWGGRPESAMCSDLNRYPREGLDPTPWPDFMLIPEIPVSLPST